MRKRKRIGKKPAAVIITAIVFIVIANLHLAGVFHFLENKSYDMRVRFMSQFNHFSKEK